MKKILLATVATSVLAAPAFAFNVNTAIEDAIGNIDAAYEALDSNTSLAVRDDLENLMFYADNHGSVSNIQFSDLTFDEDAQAFSVGDLDITYHDYTVQINSAIDELAAQVQMDVYGADENGVAYLDADDLVVSEDDTNNWSMTGVAGLVGTYLSKDMEDDQGLIAELNDLESSLAAGLTGEFNATTIGDINTAVASLNTEAADFTEALNAVETSQADVWVGGSVDTGEVDADNNPIFADVYSHAVRGEAAAAYQTVVDADGGMTSVRTEVSLTDMISIDSVSHTYDSYVDSLVD